MWSWQGLRALPGSPIMLRMKVSNNLWLRNPLVGRWLCFPASDWLGHALCVLWLRWRGDSGDLWATQADTWHVMDATHITQQQQQQQHHEATLGTQDGPRHRSLTAANLYFTLNRKSNLTPGSRLNWNRAAPGLASWSVITQSSARWQTFHFLVSAESAGPETLNYKVVVCGPSSCMPRLH